ncbi:Transposase and inactivated derivatives [Actinomyces howellii]|uniref:Transposase and inactivated derivatives n=1 Tax=Actinomyces howellii TaxID=52771 RepID=A0A448HDF3_9ACTO|nr:Transposase and inactivated derivatives [Actinomyces howellii]
MAGANAPLTPGGRRRLACLVVEQGWSLRRAAERFQVWPATVSRWVVRCRAGQSMEDRSSRPHRSPGRLARRTERRIIALRVTRRWGPHRIAFHLRLARSTVGRVLTRCGVPRLAEVDQATGLVVRRPAPVRYDKEHPGELVHVDAQEARPSPLRWGLEGPRACQVFCVSGLFRGGG